MDGWVDVSNKQSGTDSVRVQGPVSHFFLTAFPELLFSLSLAPGRIHKLQCQACQHNETWGEGNSSEATQDKCQMYSYSQVPVRSRNGHISCVLEKGKTRVVGSDNSALLSSLRPFLHLSLSCLPSVKCSLGPLCGEVMFVEAYLNAQH